MPYVGYAKYAGYARYVRFQERTGACLLLFSFCSADVFGGGPAMEGSVFLARLAARV